jgi:HEPN domain-containing protein
VLNREQFVALLEEIDKSLSESEVLFQQRPLHAFNRLAKKLDPEGRFFMRLEEHIPDDDFSNDALCMQVHRWYEKRYGDRIKIHMGPGSYLITIKGEPWEVELPSVYGQVSFTIDRNLSNDNRYKVNDSGRQIPEINILCHVKDMTQEIASNLSDAEREEILKDYMFGLNAVQFLRDMHKVEYMKQANNDYDTAVNNVFYKYPDYNNSKWASLQFAEKSMKAKLTQKGVSFKRSHNLSGLAKSLSTVGINIPAAVIDKIQCSAGVRYGEENITREDAIGAIKSSLSLFSMIFEASSFAF